MSDGVPGVHRRPRKTDEPQLQSWSAVVAVLPAALAIAVCLRGVAKREMWNDEYATWHAATLPFGDLDKLLRRTDLVHASYYLFMHFWIEFIGDSPFLLRLPSLVAMGLAAAGVALVGRRLVSTPVGLVAGTIFAVIPSISRYGQEARSYAIVTMGATFATLMLLRALEKDTRRRLVLYGGSVAVVGLVHFVALAVLAAHAVLILRVTHPNEARRWRVAETAGIALLAVIPLLALASHQSKSISWIKADAAAVKTFPEDVFLSAPVAGAIIVLALLGTIFLLVSPRPGDRAVAAMLATWALVPPIFCYVSFSVLHLFLPRYVLFVLPAWSILAAVAACRTGQVVWRHLWPLTAIVAVGVVAWVGMPAQGIVRESPVAGQPDYRGAITTIHDKLKSGDGIVYNDTFGQLSDLAREAVAYEMRDEPQPRDVFLRQTAQARGSYSASECPDSARCLGSAPRLWLIYTGYSPDPFADMPSDRAALLKLDYAVAQTYKFSGVRLVLLTKAG